MKKNIPELYGSLVFNDKVMKSKLPRDVYAALRKTVRTGTHMEMDDHYFGALRSRVSNFMKDLDEELWKYGILSREELFSRYEIMQENYVKTLTIEAKTFSTMMVKTFHPARSPGDHFGGSGLARGGGRFGRAGAAA